MIKRVQKESSNLDIDFSDIEEGNTGDEISPLMMRKQTFEGLGMVDPQAKANMNKAVNALYKN